MPTTKEQRVDGIKSVIRLAISLSQPVFCGKIAFECCEDAFGPGVTVGKFYTYIDFEDIEIILCEEMQEYNFFTTPMVSMPVTIYSRAGCHPSLKH